MANGTWLGTEGANISSDTSIKAAAGDLEGMAGSGVVLLQINIRYF